MRTARARLQAGFTLLEMMVVVAIIAVLASLAIVYIHPHTKPIDVSYRVAEIVREASREAVDYGPVSTAVAGSAGTTARTCILGSGTGGSSPTFTLNLQVGDLNGGTTSTWDTIEIYSTASSVAGQKWSPEVGSAGAVSSVSTDWNTFKLCCYANGTCDRSTLFFEATYAGGPSYERQSRLSVLPLGAATLIKGDWSSP